MELDDLVQAALQAYERGKDAHRASTEMAMVAFNPDEQHRAAMISVVSDLRDLFMNGDLSDLLRDFGEVAARSTNPDTLAIFRQIALRLTCPAPENWVEATSAWRDYVAALRASPTYIKFDRERVKLIQKHERTPKEEARLKVLDRYMEEIPVMNSPMDERAMEIIHRAAERLRQDKGSERAEG